jgi:hypothetical protein
MPVILGASGTGWRIPITGLLSFLLVACGASATPSTSPPISASPTPGSSPGSISAPPPSSALPTPTGAGFCMDRGYAVEAADLVRAGQEPWSNVAAFIAATQTIIKGDAASAPSSEAAFKVRQLAIVLHTLELSVRGSVENYPDDTSSQGWAHDLPNIVREVSQANNCEP